MSTTTLSQVSAVEQADNTGAEKPPTNDTHMELVSHAIAVPFSTRSSPRLAEQSRKRSAGEIELNRQAALRHRRESAASTSLYAQLRPLPPPPLHQPRGAVAPPATVVPVDVYAVLDQCPEGRYSGSANSAKLYLQRKGIEYSVGCPALQRRGVGHRKHSDACAYAICRKRLTKQRR